MALSVKCHGPERLGLFKFFDFNKSSRKRKFMTRNLIPTVLRLFLFFNLRKKRYVVIEKSKVTY
jgi:hypothetical protein